MENNKKLKEKWKPVPDFPDYMVSDLGRVKSLKYNKERILKPQTDAGGYKNVALCENNKCFTKHIHQLVLIAFLDHQPNGFKIVVDHINNDKTNNRLDNLQLITNRENSTKDKTGGTSKYAGVSWKKTRKKWKAQICINGKSIFLGYFDNENEAAEAYQTKLKTL